MPMHKSMSRPSCSTEAGMHVRDLELRNRYEARCLGGLCDRRSLHSPDEACSSTALCSHPAGCPSTIDPKPPKGLDNASTLPWSTKRSLSVPTLSMHLDARSVNSLAKTIPKHADLRRNFPRSTSSYCTRSPLFPSASGGLLSPHDLVHLRSAGHRSWCSAM